MDVLETDSAEKEPKQARFKYNSVTDKCSLDHIKSSQSQTNSTDTNRLADFSFPPKSFIDELRPWSYTSEASFFKSLLRPFPFFLSPAVWFSFFACEQWFFLLRLDAFTDLDRWVYDRVRLVFCGLIVEH